MAKIWPKKERTWEKYKDVASWVLICREVILKTCDALDDILPCTEVPKLCKLIQLIDDLRDRAQRRLWHDCPNLIEKEADLFWVNYLSNMDDLSKELTMIAREHVCEMFSKATMEDDDGK